MPIQIGRSKQLSRKVKCWCPVHGDVDVNIDVDADVEADFDADVDADVPYPVESGWRPRASFDWSKAAQSTKLLWTTALDQLLWHLSWETGNTVQTNQGNALSCRASETTLWSSKPKMQRPVSMEWSLMIHVQYCLYQYVTQICRAWSKHPNILLVKNRQLWEIWNFGLSIYLLLQSGGLYQRCGCRIKYATKYQIYKMFIKRNSITNIKFTSCS